MILSKQIRTRVSRRAVLKSSAMALSLAMHSGIDSLYEQESMTANGGSPLWEKKRTAAIMAVDGGPRIAPEYSA